VNAPATAAPGLQPATTGTLLRLAWPIVVSRSTQVVIGLCDAIMVAHLGKVALAATTTGAMNTFLLLILPMGICFIVASFASQLYGAADGEGARRYGFYGLAVAAGTQVLSIGGIALVPLALGGFDYEPALRSEMTGYLQARLWGGGAAVGIEALASYYGGVGNTVRPMRANLLAMVLNVGLNWVLIDGHLGAPAMGVRGAAIASAISTAIAFGWLLLVFLLEGRAEGRVVPKLRSSELGRMLRFGLPSGLNWFFEFLAFMFFVNVVVARLGTLALAALMSVIQLNSVAFMPAFALASAGAILVGQRIGADRKDEVPRIVTLTFRAAAIWQCSAGLAYLAIPALLFRPFAPEGTADSAQLLAVGVRMLMLSAAWQFFDATVAAFAEALRAAGDTAFTLWARLAVAWLVFAPGSYVSVRLLGGGELVAVAWVVAYIALLAGVLTLRFRSGAWRQIRLVETGTS